MNRKDPFSDLLRALSENDEVSEELAVRIDRTRRERTGVPEVIYGRGKTTEQIAHAALRLIDAEGRALIARIEPLPAEAVVSQLASRGLHHRHDPVAHTIAIWKLGAVPGTSGGRVAILTAGSSDRPQALEAAHLLEEMGCEIVIRFDMGIAGLHRLVRPLREVVEFDPDVLIVVAGMDGVLPGVVSGLVSLPIVALPTSTGYGFGGEGIGALTTMLQSCSPGTAVVNIDNGIGAGAMAGLIANRAAAQRSGGI